MTLIAVHLFPPDMSTITAYIPNKLDTLFRLKSIERLEAWQEAWQEEQEAWQAEQEAWQAEQEAWWVEQEAENLQLKAEISRLTAEVRDHSAAIGNKVCDRQCQADHSLYSSVLM
jgi:hypothetical protein